LGLPPSRIGSAAGMEDVLTSNQSWDAWEELWGNWLLKRQEAKSPKGKMAIKQSLVNRG